VQEDKPELALYRPTAQLVHVLDPDVEE